MSLPNTMSCHDTHIRDLVPLPARRSRSHPDALLLTDTDPTWVERLLPPRDRASGSTRIIANVFCRRFEGSQDGC